MLRNRLAISQATSVSHSRLSQVLAPFGLEADEQLTGRVQTYVELLLRWNRSVNLTSLSNVDEILARHFAESFLATRLISLTKGRLVDIGSGAGFPGLAIKLVFSELDLVLIEANKKKVVFLQEVARALNMRNVTVKPMRLDQVDPEGMNAINVTARAVGQFQRILDWSRLAALPSGHLILWLSETDARTIIKDKNWVWKEPTKIPRSTSRVILIGARKSQG